MELCLYNAVLTGMSLDGTKFTYVNQMASSVKDLSKRKDWFTCACCPPNVTRLLGYIGGYLWTVEQNTDPRSVSLNVHLYEYAAIDIPVGEEVVTVSQESCWPWNGHVDFRVLCPGTIDLTIKLRIPSWASNWEVGALETCATFYLRGLISQKLSPSHGDASIQKGYLTLSPEWLRKNPEFRLNISLKPRLIMPHPNTSQNIVAIARGPLVYCLEDVDNPWVEDHFKVPFPDLWSEGP